MDQKVGKEIWGIFQQVMTQEQYMDIADDFRQSIDNLQKISDSISDVQRAAIDWYSEAIMNLHETMMAISLRKNSTNNF